MPLFRLDASIRGDDSATRKIADIVENEWSQAQPQDEVIRRDIVMEPVGPDAWAHAVSTRGVEEEDHSLEQRAAVGAASRLALELDAADEFLFAVPLYNFGVSQHFKTWVDLVMTEDRLRPRPDPLLQGRPAVLVTARGGAYGERTPRYGWDHALPWMRRILEDVWQLELTVVETELTLADLRPPLDEHGQLAIQIHAAANELARSSGRALGLQRGHGKAQGAAAGHGDHSKDFG